MGRLPIQKLPLLALAIVLANAAGAALWLVERNSHESKTFIALLFVALSLAEVLLVAVVFRRDPPNESFSTNTTRSNWPHSQTNRSHGPPKEMGDFNEVLRLSYGKDGSLFDPGLIRAELLEHAFSTVPYRVFWKDTNSVYRGCNRKFLEDVQLSSFDEVIGKTDFDMPWGVIAHECQQDDRDVLESGRPKFQYEVQNFGANGVLQWLLVSKVPIYDRGKVIGTLGTYDNITSLKLAEQERDQLRQYLQNIFDSMPSALIGVDAQGKVTQWNGAAEKWSSLAGKPRPGMPLEEAFPLLVRALPAILRAVLDRRLWKTTRVCAKTGDCEGHYDVVVYPLSAQGQGAVIRVDDVSDLAVKDELLRQAQKMESIGQLAGGLAHDFNNSLVGVKGSISLLKARIAKLDTDQTGLDELFALAENGMGSATNMVQRLLTLARRHVVAFQTEDLRQIVDNVLKICATTFPRDVELKLTLPDEAALMRCDRTQIEQALLNLCINAVDAMATQAESRSNHALLHVAIEAVEPDDDRFRHHFPNAKPGQYWALRVIDNGIGMSAATATKIFDPFFTTKKGSKGTGLGLSMVHGIVRQHDGAIDVLSEPNCGSTFTLYFPRSFDAPAAQLAVCTTSAAPACSGLVLLADDNANVRLTLQCMLVDSGYSVLCAKDGDEAVELFRRRKSDISVVLLDMSMPKCSGKEAFHAMQSIAPQVPVLIMSGYDAENEVSETLKLGARDFLKKPFSLEDLTEKLQRAVPNQRPYGGVAELRPATA